MVNYLRRRALDGFETCRRLKTDRTTQKIPVIFITAKTEPKEIVRGFRVGGVDYITKPFHREEVCARVRTHLSIKHLEDRLREANDRLSKSYSRLESEDARKTEELQTASMVQQGFLPVSPPDFLDIEIAPFQRPATEVGGDYYDFCPKLDGQLVIAVGDATGHGVGAALMVAATKMALLMVEAPDLLQQISELNNRLKQINSYHRLNMALTLVEISRAVTSGRVQIKATGGGMPPLYILRENGNVEEILIEGLPLGAMAEAEYRLTEFQLEQSDVLILMSDGLPERQNDSSEMYGYTRLYAEIERYGETRQNAEEILQALVESSDKWSNHTPPHDDITLVVLKVTWRA